VATRIQCFQKASAPQIHSTACWGPIGKKGHAFDNYDQLSSFKAYLEKTKVTQLHIYISVISLHIQSIIRL